MKINKKQVGLIIGVVCVVILILLLLTMCSSGSSHTGSNQSDPIQTSVDVTDGSGQPEQETGTETVETTEATEETEETTEETEPTTDSDSSSGGSSTPGGTSGYTPGLGTDNNDDSSAAVATEPIPDAGSQGSPYMENVSSVVDPDQNSFRTVTIPSGGSVYYNLNISDAVVKGYGETLLTAEAAPNTFIVYQGKTYTADESGVVSLSLATSAASSAPVSIQIGSTVGSAAAPVALTFRAPLGTKENPQIVTANEDGTIAIQASLAAGDSDGYFYSFTALDDGTLTLQLDSVTENVDCDIIVTIGDAEPVNLSDMESCTLIADVAKAETVSIQIITNAPQDSTDNVKPAAQVQISGSIDFMGNASNPIAVSDGFTTKEIAPDGRIYYLVQGQNGQNLTIASEAAFIIYKEQTYTDEDGDGAVSVKIANADAEALVVIGNRGEAAASFDVTFETPVGRKENPALLLVANVDETGTNTAVVDPGDEDVYWYTWKNEGDPGMFSITMPEEGSWMFTVIHSTEDGDKVTSYETLYSDGESPVRHMELLLETADVLDIVVSTYNPEEPTVLPEGSVQFEASFKAHTRVPYTGGSYVIEAGETTYFLQGILKATDMIMTVNGVGDFTIVYEGETYLSQDGTIQITGIETDSYFPDRFSITNNSDVQAEYEIVITFPPGNENNPVIMNLESGSQSYSIKVKAATSGAFYEWTAPAAGKFTFTVHLFTRTQPWSYNIAASFTSEVKSVIKTYTGSVAQGEETSVTIDIPNAGDTLRIGVGDGYADNTHSFTYMFVVSFTRAMGEETAQMLTVEETEQLTYADLTQTYKLVADSNGFYHMDTTDGPLVLVNFTDDTFVNLKNAISELDLKREVTAEDGSVTQESCEAILSDYIKNAVITEVSEDVSHTLYPLTEELMYILQSAGKLQGWYDSTNANYQFGDVAEELREETLWMFACCYITDMETLSQELEEQSPQTESGGETEPEQGMEEADSETESEQETESEAETETEPEQETESEAESETKPEQDTESEADSETEPEQKTESQPDPINQPLQTAEEDLEDPADSEVEPGEVPASEETVTESEQEPATGSDPDSAGESA